MKTACSLAAVVTTSDKEHVLVIGGNNIDYWTTTVELFHVRSRCWSDLACLPQPLHFPSVTLCSNHIHVVGVCGNGYSCSFQDLPATSQSRSCAITWTPLPPLPVKFSTAATLCGQLILIGGWRGLSHVNSIHQLVGEQWVEIGSMSSDRWGCIVVSPSTDKIMIVGGITGSTPTNMVEECGVVQ